MSALHRIFFLLLLTLFSCEKKADPVFLELISIKSGNIKFDLAVNALNDSIISEYPLIIRFTTSVDTQVFRNSVRLLLEESQIPYYLGLTDSTFTGFTLNAVGNFLKNKSYSLVFESTLVGISGEKFNDKSVEFITLPGTLAVKKIFIDNTDYNSSITPSEISLNPVISILFDAPLNPLSFKNSDIYMVNSLGVSCATTSRLSDDKRQIDIELSQPLSYLSKHSLYISSDLKGAEGENFNGSQFRFYTEADLTPKFPLVSDEELLTLIQQQTFRFFWDYAHPVSGMIRERNGSGDLVTIGGSGFGMMSLIVAIERGFISRAEAVDRLTKMVSFLESADRFHGAWGHWYNGATGKIIPFSTKDNGGDIVETSYAAQGLLTFRQYLDINNSTELSLVNRINNLLETIEWNWYNRDNQNILSWHWSPTLNWAMGMNVRGYNEALITYFMAATSSNHSISAEVYHTGWAGTSGFINGKTFYGYTLPLGFNYGGPLFFAHYSFLGLDPRGLSDSYANYWQQNVNHSLINNKHCIENPYKFISYSDQCWGLTASDDNLGYGVHEPTRDIGVISPTAALSSMPYTPQESMKAARYFYYVLGDRLWGEYGFYDAFNVTAGWWGRSFLAIDQGPIIVMIENYRSALLWNLFMSAPEVTAAMNRLGFSKI